MGNVGVEEGEGNVGVEVRQKEIVEKEGEGEERMRIEG